MIRQYLSDIIIDHNTQGEWTIQLTLVINFVSSRGLKETRIMHFNSDSIEFMIGSETDEIVEVLFESLLKKYQEGLEGKMRQSEFIFDGVDLLYYKLHRRSLNIGGSYIDSPEWLKNKKAAINPINKKYDNFFQYAITVALNYEETVKNLERIAKIKPFINKYN